MDAEWPERLVYMIPNQQTEFLPANLRLWDPATITPLWTTSLSKPLKFTIAGQ
jgi:hypothetical protein